MSLPRRIEQSLIAFAGVRESVRVVFRLHPSERDRRSTLEDVVELDEQPLYESLSGSDVVITISSTVGYQAALMGKQLITVTGSVNEVNAPYGKMGLSRHVDVEGLPAAILAELSGAPRPAISGLPPVGEATRRIARLVEELT